MRIEDVCLEPAPPVDEENWDIEKWRNSKPMDYIKAIKLLSLADNCDAQAELFIDLYRISRLTIPDVLYKYYSFSSDDELNGKKLRTLEAGKIYMADPKSFNDPFDGRGFFYDPQQLTDIDRLKPHGGKLIDDFTSFIRSTSLTANGVQSMPMWAHYGGNHNGYCIVYDMRNIVDNVVLVSHTLPVQYVDERLDVTSIIKKYAEKLSERIEHQLALGCNEIETDDLIIVFMSVLLCNLKLSSWSGENEFRCTTPSNANGMPYINAKPKEIYIGMKCEQQYEQQLISIGKAFQIPVYKMAFNDVNQTGELISQRIS